MRSLEKYYQRRGMGGTAVMRHCTYWYEIWALTDHEIYYIEFALDSKQPSDGPFLDTEKGLGVGPTPRES